MEKSRKTISLLMIFTACLLLAFCQGMQGQTPGPTPKTSPPSPQTPPQSKSSFQDQVDRLFKDLIKTTAPGAAVVVALKGAPIFLKCYGLANVEQNVPITPETKFNLASVSKQFVAFSILLLEKEGKLGLDDDIHKYLPDLPAYPSTVTIRHLLNHTSGIWEYSTTMTNYCGYDGRDLWSLQEIMALLKYQKKLLFEPGSQWSYCNTNYLLLARVVEKATGITFQEWTKKNVFDPLEMKSSLFFKNSSQVIPGKAECYQREKGELVIASGSWVDYVGPSYLFTTVKDMALWMDNFRTKKVGGPELVDKMFQKATLNDGSQSYYGFGLGVLPKNGKVTVGHAGQTAGYKTSMLYCPELELGIAVLANERSIDSDGLANIIFDLYLGKPQVAPSASAKKAKFLPYNQEAAAGFGGGYIVEGPNIKMAVNAEEQFLHGAIVGMGEEFFYPTAERTFSDRPGENVVEFTDISNGLSQTALVAAKGNKMTARRIALNAKDLEARLPGYPGSYYSEAFGTAYSFRVENGRLIMHHRRYGDLRTQAIDADEFLCLLGFVKFNRDAKGEVVGFTLTPSDEKFNFQGVEFIKVRL